MVLFENLSEDSNICPYMQSKSLHKIGFLFTEILFATKKSGLRCKNTTTEEIFEHIRRATLKMMTLNLKKLNLDILLD